jgi:hypothetical protein
MCSWHHHLHPSHPFLPVRMRNRVKGEWREHADSDDKAGEEILMPWRSQQPSSFLHTAPWILLWSYCALCFPFPFLIWNNFSSCGQQLQFPPSVLKDCPEILPGSRNLTADKLYDHHLACLKYHFPTYLLIPWHAHVRAHTHTHTHTHPEF